MSLLRSCLHVREEPLTFLQKEGILGSSHRPLSAHLIEGGGLLRCRCLVEKQKGGSSSLSAPPNFPGMLCIYLGKRQWSKVCLQILTSSFVSIWASVAYFCLITISQGPNREEKTRLGVKMWNPEVARKLASAWQFSIFPKRFSFLLSLLPLKGLKRQVGRIGADAKLWFVST